MAQKGGATDLSILKTNAYNQLGIDEQVARQMETAAAQVGIFEESMNTLKATLGKPFLEGKAAIFKTFNNILAQTTIYFKEHPEVTKFMVAIAGGVSGLLLVTGIIMTLVGVVGSLKLVFSIAEPQIAVFFAPVLPVLATVIVVVGVIAGIAIWHGIVAAATFIQTAWNLAMNGGTAATIAQKIAGAALYPIMLVVKGASLLWTGIQWALNAAMMAFPGTWIIMIILAVIAVVALIVTYLKKVWEWVQKAWDKLKGFLGFKKEAKEELEDPINVTVNENGEGQVIPVTQETGQISPIQQVQQVAQQTVQLNPTVQGIDVNQMVQQSVGTTQIPVELIPYMKNSGISDEEIKQNLGLPEDYEISVDLQISGTGNEQIDQIMQQYENGVDLSQAQEQLTGFTGDMNILGADGTNQFAQGLSGSDALGALGTSVGDINSTITNGLLKNEEMKTYGSNLIQSFIDGMQDKDFQLSTAVSSVAQKLGGINELKYARNLFHDMKNLEELQAERYFSKSRENTAKSSYHSSNSEQKENEKTPSPIYIMIQGADKNQEEIAKAVAKELEKRGFGQKKKSSDFSLTMSPYGFRMRY